MIKKAQVFDMGMVFLVIGAMAAVLFVVNTIAKDTSPLYSIGQRAFEIQNAYAQGDYITMFMSSGARWAAAKSVINLGVSGGFITDSPCGKSGGLQFWNDKSKPDKFCSPPVYENFYALLGREVAKYSRLYSAQKRKIVISGKEIDVSSKQFEIPYEFVVVGNRLMGIATQPAYINVISPPEAKQFYSKLDLFGLGKITNQIEPGIAGQYFFRPDFDISFDYNLEVYGALQAAAQDIVKNCKGLINEQERKDCATQKIEDWLTNIREKGAVNVQVSGNSCNIQFTQTGKGNVYSSGKEPVINFGIEIPV
jgi:hypothetical protein